MNYEYVSIDRIFSKLIRDVTDDFNESDVVEWCGEALEFTRAAKSYEEAVSFVEVKNHQCGIPKGTHAIIQIARNNRWTGPKDDSLCPAQIITTDYKAGDQTAIPVALDCDGQPINAYDLAYYRPYFDLKWEYNLWRDCGNYRANFTPIRLATSSLFNSLVCREITDHRGVCNYGKDEYTVIERKILRFSFKEGFVAIARLRQVVDPESGYPMVPDNISYTTAIIKYITWMMLARQCFNGREASCGKADKAEAHWDWYCKQATNVDKMPQTIDEMQNLLDQRSYMIPQQNRYYGFFGNLNTPESRRFNDSDHRNRGGHFLG